MRLLTMILLVILVSACSFFTEEYDDSYGSGYINVSESEWHSKYNEPYPFSVPDGEISCGLDPQYGRTVYFEPLGFTDESYIGTPLNQAAFASLSYANMRSNVPYSLKKDANLNTAIKLGLRVCDEYQELLGA